MCDCLYKIYSFRKNAISSYVVVFSIFPTIANKYIYIYTFLGADVNYRMNESGWTPLMYAASIGAKDAVDLLLNNGADPNYHYEHRTPLMCLCESTSFDGDQLGNCFNALIEAGADINAKDINRF